MKTIIIAVLALALLPSLAASQASRIFLKDDFSDWQHLTPLYQDPANDFGGDQIDFHNLWVTNDERYLYLRIQLGQLEVALQESNALVVYLDTDNNAQTGLQVQSIGAELEWHFGQRAGTFYNSGQTFSISHINIGIITAPTVSSTEFEIRFDRSATLANNALLFNGTVIKLAFASLSSNGDKLPEASQQITYTFDDTELSPLKPRSLQKQNPSDLRFLSYNVERDAFFDNARLPAYSRLLRAIQPDIIAFQEIFSGTAEQARIRVASMLPLTGGQQWHAAKANPDIVVVSRYSIKSTFEVENNGAFLVDLRPDYDSNLLLIGAHPPCCTNNEGRQFEIDAMMAFIRDAKTQGGVLDLAPNTPIMLMGDFNLVGDSQHLRTMLTGEIINSQFGPSFSPDWDGSHFADLTPRNVDTPTFFTWFQPASSFSPARLDFIIYSDNVLETTNSFVLFTPEVPSDTLLRYNLLPDDSNIASDHLPVVGDFTLRSITSVSDRNPKIDQHFPLSYNYPNPFNPSTTIVYTIPASLNGEHVTLKIYNTLGEEVRSLISRPQTSGQYQIQWDGKDNHEEEVPSGAYFYRLSLGREIQSSKMLLVQIVSTVRLRTLNEVHF